MAPMSEEDLEWFKSTFRPIPRPQLPDDAVEYSLHLISSSPTPAAADEVALARARLQEVQKSASELVKDLLKDYIWQREAFGLQITKENGMSVYIYIYRMSGRTFFSRHSADNKGAGKTFLQGRTSFGDSIEDEWVIVYLLRELTKKYKDLWVRVVDSDGEFLLIEAAAHLPAWLEPEVADNRVSCTKTFEKKRKRKRREEAYSIRSG